MNLAITHLAILAAIALWLGMGHAGAGPGMVMLMGAALAVQSIHGSLAALLDRFWMRELMLASVALAVWLWVGCPLHPLIGLGVAAVMLVPARRACLRYVVVLAAADLVSLGTMTGRTGGMAPVNPWLAAGIDTAIALAALAGDAWHESGHGARGLRRGGRRGAPWRWCLPPVLVALALAVVLMPTSAVRRGLGELTPARPGGRIDKVRTGTGLQTQLQVGGVQSILRDQTVCARLAWDDPGLGNTAVPRPGPMIYLRALALSRLRCEGPYLGWSADTSDLRPVEEPIPAGALRGVVLRLPGGGDAVYRIDGGSGIALANLVGDGDGNRFRSLLGNQPVSYVVSLATLDDDDAPGPAVGVDGGWRKLPSDLFQLPWADVLDTRWAGIDPQRAAQAITQFLRDRCRYELDNLPEPAPVAGGALRTFLLDDDPRQRRGHCQYFATAMVVLLRLSGHQARCVVGFASEELDANGATFRGLHAHAWAEVVGRDGRWHRVDATPVAGFMIRSQGLDQTLAQPPPKAAVPPPPPPPKPLPAWVWGALVGLLLALVVWGLRAWQRRPRRSRQATALAKHRDALVALASELGIPVHPATTLSQLAAALERRTGLDLSRILAAQLAARYGSGPLPPPWPISALRAAASEGGQKSARLLECL
jgi:hypothetical protein